MKRRWRADCLKYCFLRTRAVHRYALCIKNQKIFISPILVRWIADCVRDFTASSADADRISRARAGICDCSGRARRMPGGYAGPLKHKRNDMLACPPIGSLAALATGLAAYRPLTLWLTVAPLAFMVSMLDVYGAKWPRISFAALMMMVITLSQSLTFKQAWINALCLLGGGLWYTCWSAAVNRWQAERMEQQAIGESIFAVAEYLRARARLYDSKNDLDECYRNLVARQVAVVDAQDAARDLVLRNLPVLRAGRLDARRTMLFNLFVNMVDLHQMVLAAHTDYAQ